MNWQPAQLRDWPGITLADFKLGMALPKTFV